MKSEHHWIRKAAQGEQPAFKALYELHCDSLFRFMKQFSADQFQVEDWVQRAFIKAFRNVQTYSGEARFSTWLFTIAMNEMKSDKRKPSLVVLTADDLREEAGPAEDERFVWHDAMRTLLAELDETKRSVFVLYEVEGYSHAEIAGILGIGQNASRTILCRVKQTLRTQWELLENQA